MAGVSKLINSILLLSNQKYSVYSDPRPKLPIILHGRSKIKHSIQEEGYYGLRIEDKRPFVIVCTIVATMTKMPAAGENFGKPRVFL